MNRSSKRPISTPEQKRDSIQRRWCHNIDTLAFCLTVNIAATNLGSCEGSISLDKRRAFRRLREVICPGLAKIIMLVNKSILSGSATPVPSRCLGLKSWKAFEQ